MSEHSLAVKEKDLQENKPVRIDVKNKPIVLTKVSSKVYAMDAVAPMREDHWKMVMSKDTI